MFLTHSQDIDEASRVVAVCNLVVLLPEINTHPTLFLLDVIFVHLPTDVVEGVVVVSLSVAPESKVNDYMYIVMYFV